MTRFSANVLKVFSIGKTSNMITSTTRFIESVDYIYSNLLYSEYSVGVAGRSTTNSSVTYRHFRYFSKTDFVSDKDGYVKKCCGTHLDILTDSTSSMRCHVCIKKASVSLVAVFQDIQASNLRCRFWLKKQAHQFEHDGISICSFSSFGLCRDK